MTGADGSLEHLQLHTRTDKEVKICHAARLFSSELPTTTVARGFPSRLRHLTGSRVGRVACTPSSPAGTRCRQAAPAGLPGQQGLVRIADWGRKASNGEHHGDATPRAQDWL